MYPWHLWNHVACLAVFSRLKLWAVSACFIPGPGTPAWSRPVGPEPGSHNQNIIGNIKNAISNWDTRAGHHSEHCPQVLQIAVHPGYFSDLSKILNCDGWILVTYLLFTPGYKSPLSRDEALPPAPSPQIRCSPCRCWVIIQCHTFCTGE